MNKTKTALLAAATWLENNKDRHITGNLSLDAENQPCDPTSPKAECFCALGRFAKELDVSTPIDEWGTQNYDPFMGELKPFNIEAVEIFSPNDQPENFGGKPWDVTPFCTTARLSGQPAIDALRQAAARIPDEAED